MQKTILAKAEGRLAIGTGLDTHVSNLNFILVQQLGGLAIESDLLRFNTSGPLSPSSGS